MKPDYGNAHTDILYFDAGINSWWIPPGGYLIAVTAEIDLQKINERQDTPYVFHITNGSHNHYYGIFRIDYHLGIHKGGIVFRDPLINVNTADGYLLETREPIPAVKTYITQCWPER